MNDSTATRSICLCSGCEERVATPQFKKMFSDFGHDIMPSILGNWFMGHLQCNGCGTTERGSRYRHELRALSPDEQKLLEQTPLCEFNEYDKLMAYAARIDLAAKDERIKK